MFVSIFAASDDMIENENEMLRDRVCALEKKVYDQNDEITCLRATLADCLRRINGLELNKVTNHNSRPVGSDKYLVFNQHQLSSHRAHAH